MLCAKIEPKHIPQALESIGCEKGGAEIMRKKGEILSFYLCDLSVPQLHILKQELLSVGGDLATPKDAILAKDAPYNALIIATKSQLERVIHKCKHQPFALKAFSKILAEHLHPPRIMPASTHIATPRTASTEQSTHKPGSHRIIMPIINLTPDSFYAPSRKSPHTAIESIIALLEEGAEMIDIGAASSRPGSKLISAEEEIARLREVCDFIAKEQLYKQAHFSIDTYNAKTAAFALESGFRIVNDISALSDSDMLSVLEHFCADFILMHTRGTPETMNSLTHYTHLLSEIDEFFTRKLELLESKTIGEVILDIGFGFAKNTAQNIALVQNLTHFAHFGKRILVGASQKRSIGEITGASEEDRLSGTLSLHLLALQNGAHIIRAHHFKEHIHMLKIFQAFMNPSMPLSSL